MKSTDKSMVISLSSKIAIILIGAFLIGILLEIDLMRYAKGLALGGIFTILKIYLMQLSFSRAIHKAPKAAINYARFHYMIRYLLTTVVVIVAILEPSLHPIGVIIGLLSLKLAAYWQGYQEKPVPKDGSIVFEQWEDDEEESKDF